MFESFSSSSISIKIVENGIQSHKDIRKHVPNFMLEGLPLPAPSTPQNLGQSKIFPAHVALSSPFSAHLSDSG